MEGTTSGRSSGVVSCITMGTIVWDHRRNRTALDFLRSQRFSENWWAHFMMIGFIIVSAAFFWIGLSVDTVVHIFCTIGCLIIDLSLLIGSLLGFMSARDTSRLIKDQEDYEVCQSVLEE
jgi:hypothetical protein